MSSRLSSAATAGTDGPAAYWPVPLTRAIFALAVGLSVTFIADHSPRIGFIALGVLALTTGLTIALLGRGRVADATAARILTAQGVLAAVLGAISLALLLTSAGVGSLLLLATLFAVLTGALELYAGVRTRRTVGRDWVTTGAGTIVFALVLLIAPLDSVAVVGFIGAYAVILGVFLVIAALSLKWAGSDTTLSAAVPADAEPSTGATR